jgi:7-carboxy-7-deazaguanine synthase
MLQTPPFAAVEERERLENKELPVMEIFGPTVQGEGAVIGQQTFFIRFGLCDYKCTMCDSMHAVDPQLVSQNAKWMKQEDIYQALEKHKQIEAPMGTFWVTLSGGNPAIHDLDYLTAKLLSNQWSTAVETQGTLTPRWLHRCDVITVSPKSPGMGERFDPDVFANFLRVYRGHRGLNVKIVVFKQEDLDFASRVFRIAQTEGLDFDRFYLSQGNPYPPHIKTLHSSSDVFWAKLRTQYLHLLGKIMQDNVLSQVKFLPQWHVWLWANKQGV